MEIRFPPELEQRLADLAAQTGRAAPDLVQDAVGSYIDELADVRTVLDRRYDDLESGQVALIDGEEAFARLLARGEARRNSPA